MIPEQADARKKKFDMVREYCDRPEHYRKAYLQFLRDFYYAMNIDLDTLALSLKGIKEILSPINPSTGWQMEIHQIFKRTLFKKVRLGQITPSDAIRTYANDLGFLATGNNSISFDGGNSTSANSFALGNNATVSAFGAMAIRLKAILIRSR